MNLKATCRLKLLKNYLFTIGFILSAIACFSQKSVADSLSNLLKTETKDTGRVSLMWRLANAMYRYAPDSALSISQKALYLAQKIKYLEGESRSLGLLANSFLRIGNYQQALELNIQKLKLEEKRNQPRSLASVLMNIGVVYVNQEEYRKALVYYTKADSIINKSDVTDFKYSIVLNLGDVYDRMEVSDTALIFFNKSYELARHLDENRMGKSLTGLGHSYRKLGSNEQSLINYQKGIVFLQAANNDETFCEATLGLARLYLQMKNLDSSGYFANMSRTVAKKDRLLPQELEAVEFLAQHYKRKGNIDSAFALLNDVQELNDSINSKNQIRQLQIISSNEQFRQLELYESRRLAKEERLQQLQMLLLAIFIPGLFLLTLILSRAKLHIQVIRLLGILSLLFFFEYLTLLLHPTVAKLTHHTPIYEILIFVVMAAILIPAHHRLEHWLIHKLIHHRINNEEPEKHHE
jgi:tetratricopeptide (TPR) repeat protein